MTARGHGIWPVVALLVGGQLFGWADAADSQERLRAGVVDLTVVGGYSVSHNISSIENLETVEGFHLIPHLGYVLTDEGGPDWVRGQFELVLEPSLIRLEASKSATVAGVAALGRWILDNGWRARPFFEAGLGVVSGHVNLRQTNCDVNFLVEAGPGLLYFLSPTTAVTVGYRFHHMSNAGICSKNIGLNSSLFTFGISYLFR